MTSGDIVLEMFPRTPKSILNSPQNMTVNFNINSVAYNFSTNSGWSRSNNKNPEIFDVGFFHEVKILADNLPRDLIGGMFNYVSSTNSPVNDYRKAA